MKMEKRTTMVVSILLAIMLIGMPLSLARYSMFSSSDGAETNTMVDEPELLQSVSGTAIRMTSASEFVLGKQINLNDYFPNPYDIQEFRSVADAMYASVEIYDTYVHAVTTFGNTGDTYFTVVADYGDSEASLDFFLRVEPREQIASAEDTMKEHDISAYLDLSASEYFMTDSNDINIVMIDVSQNGSKFAYLPRADWYGTGMVSLTTHYEYYFINPPPPDDQIQSGDGSGDALTSVSGFDHIYGYHEFDVSVWNVNDPPYVVEENAYLLKITADSTLELPTPLNLDYVFHDVDSELTYSWSSMNRMSAMEIRGQYIHSISGLSVIGDDIITIIANDGEYVATYDLYLSILPRARLTMLEDTTQLLSLEQYVDIDTQEFIVSGSENIRVQGFVDYSDGSADVALSPVDDWFGRETVSLYVYPIFYTINPPIQPTSAPPGPVIPPQPTDYTEYGYYELDVIVENVNDPPVVIWTPGISMTRNTPLAYAFNIKDCFHDIDSELTYFVTQGPNAAVKATIAMDGSVSLTPAQNWFGTYALTIGATDGEYTVTTDVMVQVEYENYAPYLIEADDTVELLEDTTVTVYLEDYIQDLDHELEYTYVSTNENWTILLNETDWSMTVIPAENWSGEIDVTIYGFDGEFMIGRNLTFMVLPVNDPPEIITDMEYAMFEQGASLELNMAEMFFDVDSELRYMAYSRDGNVHATISGETLTVRAADGNWWGTDALTIAATDGEFIVELELSIHVQHVNSAPVVRTEMAELSLRQNTQFALMMGEVFYDPDGDTLSYSFESGDELALVFDGGSDTLYLTPANNWNGMTWLKITAHDGSLQTSVETMVLVTPVNMPPVQVSSIPPLNAVPGTSASVDLSDHFSDPEGSLLMYEITGTEHITVSPGPTGGVFILDIASGWEGVENLQVTVSDGIETTHGELTVSSRETQAAGASSTDIGFIQSMGWMILGMFVAVLLFVAYTANKDRRPNARTATNKGRVL